MGDSSPNIDLDQELLEFDDVSEISAIIKASVSVRRAEWTLARSEDVDAPEIICTVQQEDEDEATLRASHSAGHGPRPIRPPEQVAVTEGPRVVITLEF